MQGKRHFFGKAVFVFAGGSTETGDKFMGDLGLAEKRQKEVKLPDFRSRLKAMYEVPDIDFEEERSSSDKLATVIQRAAIVRSLWSLHTPHIQSMDEEVAFRLLTLSYKSGIRSIESIIESSTLVGETNYSLRSFPEPVQLKNHVAEKNINFAVEDDRFRKRHLHLF